MRNTTLPISEEAIQVGLNAMEGRVAISLDALKAHFTMQLDFVQDMQAMSSAKLSELQTQIDDLALRLPPKNRPIQLDVLQGRTAGCDKLTT